MKFAVISDIHGNLPALSAVLADAAEQGADSYIFAGDYCLSGPYINECIEAVRAISNAHVVRGNEEGYFANLIGSDQSTWTDGQMQISYFSYRTITKENLDYLMALPHRIDIECCGVPIHISHDKSTFLGRTEGIHWRSSVFGARYGGLDVSQAFLQREIKAANDADADLQAKLSEMPDGVYIFGHTHIQWSYRSKDGRVTLINPGSCGLPLDCLRGSVPYAILEVSEQGEVRVDERRVPWDAEGYADSLAETPQYEQAKVWTEIIMRELKTSREHLIPFLGCVEEYARSIGDDRRPYALDTWEKAYELWK